MNYEYKKLTYGLCQLCATSDDEKLQTLLMVMCLHLHYTSFITLFYLWLHTIVKVT